ncbi:phosphatidate cytidylyltransferase [Gemmobacter megaterium]|uniref:Phosphatidate cytidylyltransferase n=1 Tax=Gemmobacter megaterium TaxID=1086013 RepID=A0A1N7NRU2_9RHOB|nr:phosphatidate cytidylyltransferase [Gemmobacter megaterium]GGE16973.1 phosphatidate cytidylyltransferase [Gemmobacter megaterium]SIT01047.1 phosphatidate cytidylyltransferase [Gemmobacter megaterium]
MTGEPRRWADLKARVLSALVMVAVGAVEIWLGGLPFAALVLVVIGAMVWELARMTGRSVTGRTPGILAALAIVSLAGAMWLPSDHAELLLAVPALGLALTKRNDRRIATLYGLAALMAGYGLVALRDLGMEALIWLVAVVIASDVLGYFAGRILGGPKFWPAVSPKKTWSGTVAGWIGAALVGLAFVLWGGAGWGLVILSPLVAFAGQLGDIAESWIKRRAGVKDSSGLIPGHGGVMDRFDALIGAAVVVMALGLVMPLPLPGV